MGSGARWIFLAAITVADGDNHGWAPPWQREWGSATSTTAPIPADGIHLCYQRYEATWFGNVLQTPEECPEECPFRLRCADNPLISDYVNEGIRCVKANDCGQLLQHGYADQVDGVKMCNECGLQGCAKCSPFNGSAFDTTGELIGPISEQMCQDCSSRFTPTEGGVCDWDDETLFTIIAVVCGLIGVWVWTDFIIAHNRSVTNRGPLVKGLQARWRAKVRMYWKEQWKSFSFFVRMHSAPKDHPPVCGPGTTLFMNWFILVGAVSAWLVLVAHLLGPAAEDAIRVDSCFNVLAASPLIIGNNASFKPVFAEKPEFSFDVRWRAWSYHGAALITIWFFIHQERLWCRLNSAHLDELPGGTALDYCVEVTGFPGSATDHQKIKSFLSQELELRGFETSMVHSISIAYSYGEEEASRINMAIDMHLEHIEEKAGLAGAHTLPSLRDHSVAHSAHMDEKIVGEKTFTAIDDSSSEVEDEEDVVFCDRGPFWVQFMAYFLCGTNLRLGPFHAEGSMMAKRDTIADLPDSDPLDLDEIDNSGTVYVIFKTIEVANAFALKKTLTSEFSNGCVHTASKVGDSPAGIMWENFGISTEDRQKRTLKATTYILCGAGMWFVFYVPYIYVFDIVSGTQFAGNLATVSYLVETFAGLLIAAGNCMIALVVGTAVNQMGFRMRSYADLTYLSITIPCVLLNCLMDFYVVTNQVVEGSITCQLFGPGLNGQGCKTSDGSLQSWRILHEEWVALIMPSYAIIPYIGEPFCTILLPYLLGIWRIKRDKSISPHHAEDIMKAAEFDMVNPALGDIITTTSTIIGTFIYSPGKYSEYLFCVMFIWICFLYLQTRTRILKAQSYSYFGHNKLHFAESVAWALPLGMLCYGYGYANSNRPADEVWITGAKFFCCHCLGHVCFVTYIVPWFGTVSEPFVETYDDFMKRNEGMIVETYINTNPVEVLRSLPPQSLPQGLTRSRQTVMNSAPMVFFRPDKLFLQPKTGKATGEDLAKAISEDDQVRVLKATVNRGLMKVQDTFEELGDKVSLSKNVSEKSFVAAPV